MLATRFSRGSRGHLGGGDWFSSRWRQRETDLQQAQPGVVARQAFLKEERFLALDVELDTARRIQQSILPPEIPSMPRLAIAARYVPMTAVAGDFYDFIQLDGNRLGILVADVSGHGIPAALVASMVKIAFAGQSDRADDPARVLSGMNDALHGRVQRECRGLKPFYYTIGCGGDYLQSAA